MSSKRHEREKTKTKDEDRSTGIIVVGIGLGIAALMGTILVGPHVYGATPAQIMAEPMTRTPKQLAHDLPLTSVSSEHVRVTFRKGSAGEYEDADFDWASKRSDAPDSMRLRAEHHAKIADEVRAAMRRHLPRLRGERYRWGPVDIDVRDSGDASFQIDPQIDDKPNPLFLRQVEAAKEVVLNAAFGTPIRLPDREIVDVLGTGYSPAALASLDTTTKIEQATATLTASFPAFTTRSATSFLVPLDHPLFDYVRFEWRNQPGGRLDSMGLAANKSYADNRASLEACMEKKIGAPQVRVVDYAAARKSYAFAVGKITAVLDEQSVVLSFDAPVDPASFALLFRTLDGCRDAAESGMGTK